MGKKSPRSAPVGRAGTLTDDASVPVVGGREPCPCGSGKRYKACHGRAGREASSRLVTRPFEGLPGECDWIALRELVPAATAVVRTTGEAGDHEVTVATVLPMAWPALHRVDGSVILGLQTSGRASGDPSRDIADALLRAFETEPGTAVEEGGLPGPGPRLQDLLVPDQPFEVTVHSGFDYWLLPDQEVDAEARESIERANAAVIPTRRLQSVEGAYWCRVTDRCHLRWILPSDESAVLDGLARLHAAGDSGLIETGRYVGSFRAHGLPVPVWDLPLDIEPEELEDPVKEFGVRLEAAMAVEAPLTGAERRARAGVVSRQVTLR
ncbi:MAG: hypothetical protein QG622_375 [Actinomycetota bacterium]|nr:hypothetical protein [Actinomycetota bacterium]